MSVCDSGGEEEEGRGGGGDRKKDVGSFIPPATSSVRDVCDRSQIRSKTEFPLRFQPLTPQLGLCVIMWLSGQKTKKTNSFSDQLFIYLFTSCCHDSAHNVVSNPTVWRSTVAVLKSFLSFIVYKFFWLNLRDRFIIFILMSTLYYSSNKLGRPCWAV